MVGENALLERLGDMARSPVAGAFLSLGHERDGVGDHGVPQLRYEVVRPRPRILRVVLEVLVEAAAEPAVQSGMGLLDRLDHRPQRGARAEPR